jgi:hypothetical protein
MQILHLDNEESSELSASTFLISPSHVCGFLDQDRQLSSENQDLIFKNSSEITREGEIARP